MKEVKDSIKKRIEGSRGQALHYDAMAAQERHNAQEHENHAKQLRAEADELERILIKVYGEVDEGKA